MLNTERISLRPITDDDFSLFHRLHNEELVIKYCFDAVSDNEIKTKLNECWKNQIGEPLLSKRIVFVITEAKTGNKIGVTGFFRALDKVEVGYLLLPEFFGQGFATESLKLVIDYAKAKG